MPDAPVLVRNLSRGPAVFNDIKTATSIEWQGAGDPNGDDIQPVPASIAIENVNFLKAVSRGTFLIESSDNPEVQEAIARGAAAAMARNAQESLNAQSVLNGRTGDAVGEGTPLAGAMALYEEVEVNGKVVMNKVTAVMGPRERG